MFTDPNGLMSMKQFSSVFIPNYFYEACKNTIYSTEVSLKESVDSVYNIVKAVMSGNLDVNLNNFIEAVNPVSGTNMPNTYYVFSHLNYFNQDYVMTDEEVAAFAKSAGKIGLEIVRAGGKVYLMFTQIKETTNRLNYNVSSNNPQSYLQTALKNQGLKSIPTQMKETWIEGDYKYTVRIHKGNTQYTNSQSIYRVSRQSTILDANGQGNGLEYLGTDGNWYHESILK
jgi:hypothetical protein